MRHSDTVQTLVGNRTLDSTWCFLQKPIAYSNVALIDPVTKAACRASWRYLEDGTKVSAYSLNRNIKFHDCYTTQAMCCTTAVTALLQLQVRITRGKLASGSAIPRPALLARSSRTRSYVGALLTSSHAGCSTVQRS